MKTKSKSVSLLFFVFTLVAFWSDQSTAQDAVAVDPQHHKVEFENDHVRVLRITFGPGESSTMHSHPCAVAIGIRDSLVTFHLPDGSTRKAPASVGQVIVAKPQVHNVSNDTAETSEVILVELKDGGC